MTTEKVECKDCQQAADRVFTWLDGRITREVGMLRDDITKITSRHGQIVLLLFGNLVGIIVLLATMLSAHVGH